MRERFEPIGVDGNGVPTEHGRVAGKEVIVQYDDIPAKDITTVRGIPCTTALRTVIDIAPDLDEAHLDQVVEDGLARRLFDIDEARARIAEPDMRRRRGADLLARALNRVESS